MDPSHICRVSISALFGHYMADNINIAACHVECWSYVAGQSSKHLSKRSIVQLLLMDLA